jgi:NADH-quinone oxidoreductase subunit K
MAVGLNHYLALSGMVFAIGLFGIFWGRKTIITILMSIELMLLSVNINMVAFSSFLQDLAGQVFTMFILTVAAAEAAIGLAILLLYHRKRQNIDVEDISTMRG